MKSERDLDPEGEILSSEILLVEEVKDLPDHQEVTKFPHVFELITSKPAIYAFATPTSSEMTNWQRKLDNVINPDVFQLHGYDRWGYLEVRTSITSVWKRRFCFLKSRVLVKLSLDKAEPERIQLHACLSIQPPQDPDSPVPRELTVSFQIITQEKTFSFQAESHEEAKLWYQVRAVTSCDAMVTYYCVYVVGPEENSSVRSAVRRAAVHTCRSTASHL